MIPEHSNIYDRRLVDRLKKYWDRMKGTETAPIFSRFNGNAIQDVWDCCLSIKVVKSGKIKIYQCQEVGQKLKVAFGKELKGKYFTSFDGGGTLNKGFLKFLDYSVDVKEFVVSQGQFVNSKSKVVKYRDCIMPFVDLKGEIKLLIVGVSWRSF